MKTITIEAPKGYVFKETEPRCPKEGEWFLDLQKGKAVQAKMDFKTVHLYILEPEFKLVKGKVYAFTFHESTKSVYGKLLAEGCKYWKVAKGDYTKKYCKTMWTIRELTPEEQGK